MRSLIILFISFLSFCCWGNDHSELTNSCHPSKTLHCGENYRGSTSHERNDVQHYNGCRSESFKGKDKIFKFVKPNSRGRLTVNLFNNNGLDLFLLNRCDGSHVGCTDYSLINSDTPYAGIHKNNMSAGTYYLAVDAMSHNVHGDFTLGVTCGYLDCHAAEKVNCRQTVHGSTHSGNNDISAIKCENNLWGGYMGKEKLYYFELTRQEEVTINLSNISHGENLDLFLLRECDEYTTIACSQKSHNSNETIRKTLGPGKYYVLIDGANGSNGSYSLTVDWNCCEPQYDNHCNDITKSQISDFKYRFNVPSISIYSGAKWIIKGGIYGSIGREIGSGFSTEWTFPSAGTYTICVKYPLAHTHNCYAYCCKTITIEEPQHCEDEWNYNCGFINHHLSGNDDPFNYTLTNTSSHTALSWTINGTPITGSGNTVNYVFPSAGEYTVCFKYRKHDGCFYYCCKKIVIPNPCQDEWNYHCGFISEHFTGDFNTLSYTLTNTSSHTALSWTINGTPITDSGNTVNYVFPSAGEYTICFKYRKHDGCFYYCCKKIKVERPCQDERDFYCDKINYSFAGTNTALTYDFTNTSQASDGTWIISGGTLGSELTVGSGNSLSYTFPAPGTYTVCYRYKKHDGCYYYCCKKICVEYPFDCRLIRKQFNYQTGKYNLSLEGIGAENIIDWKNEGTGQSLGNSATLTIDNPFQCVVISVFYKDPHTGCYKVCCIQLCRVCYGEKDPDCNAINWYYNGNGFNYTFNVPNTNTYNGGMWTISGAGYSRDVMNGGTGNTLNWNFPSAGKYTICYTYTNFDGSPFSCCKTIWIQHPGECDVIHTEYNEFNQKYTLSISGAEQVQWRNDATNQVIGSGNTIEVSNPSACQFISATFFDTHTGCYSVCRVEICPYENCFGFDPFFSNPWLGDLQESLSALCHDNPNVKIETARYKGKCVVIIPPVDYTCGGPANGKGYIFDAAGNLIFSYGGVNPNFNADLLADMRNRTTLWSCDGNLNNEENDVEGRSKRASTTTTPPKAIALGNQPNPFSGETLITFTLPEATKATVRIVDALGQTAFEIEGDFTAGENEVFFSAERSLASGIYFLRLEGTNINAVHTMVVENK